MTGPRLGLRLIFCGDWGREVLAPVLISIQNGNSE
jgi:hypothetical protein